MKKIANNKVPSKGSILIVLKKTKHAPEKGH